MDKYQSHKVVTAAQIGNAIVSRQPGGDVVVTFVGVDQPYTLKRSEFDRMCTMANDAGFTGGAPIIGGYLVEYQDGYRSWSPAEVFEEGYTLVQPSSGKSKIAGYRELDEQTINDINTIKELGLLLGSSIELLEAQPDKFDPRWVAIGKTDLQKGLMFLTRAIAKPDFF